MTDLSQQDTELLRAIARPDVAGVPGALGDVKLDALLAGGFITFGFAPSTGDGPPQYTYANAWVRLTDAGRAKLS